MPMPANSRWRHLPRLQHRNHGPMNQQFLAARLGSGPAFGEHIWGRRSSALRCELHRGIDGLSGQESRRPLQEKLRIRRQGKIERQPIITPGKANHSDCVLQPAIRRRGFIRTKMDLISRDLRAKPWITSALMFADPITFAHFLWLSCASGFQPR
jgi:hypothetical protein